MCIVCVCVYTVSQKVAQVSLALTHIWHVISRNSKKSATAIEPLINGEHDCVHA